MLLQPLLPTLIVLVFALDYINSVYISYRRYLIDLLLEREAKRLHGLVLDLGGKRLNKRGHFKPPQSQIDRWVYLNINAETKPDLLSDAGNLGLGANSIDCIVCTEVLEHLSNPKACVAECLRVLKPGGVMLVSVPFLFPVHGDPQDFQRFTYMGLKQLFCDFNSVQIKAMGGTLGTIGMLIDFAGMRLKCNRFLRWPLQKCLSAIGRLCSSMETLMAGAVREPESSPFTTGYFAVATK